MTLAASEARLHGSQFRYERDEHKDNIGSWLNPEEWVDWEVKITKPGKFDVMADIAAPEAASFEVAVGAQKLVGKAPVTGSYTKFEGTKVGQIQISAAGNTVLSVRPVKEGWHPINLKSVRLKTAP
jgi:hypothetical protein